MAKHALARRPSQRRGTPRAAAHPALQDPSQEDPLAPLAARARAPQSGFELDWSEPSFELDWSEPNFARSPAPFASAAADLPLTGQADEIIDQPAAKAPAPAAPAAPAATACDAPRSMRAVKAGAFENKLTMDSYYPDLAGKGYWQNGGSGGTWDTGSRVGANVQLIGTVPGPCRPESFSFEQFVTYTKARFNGVKHAKEGVRQDDIAKSGRNFSAPPARQVWLSGGINISMADPPSMPYGPASNIEFDRQFETSLVGASGAKATVNWSTSIRVQNGRVTKNTLT